MPFGKDFDSCFLKKNSFFSFLLIFCEWEDVGGFGLVVNDGGTKKMGQKSWIKFGRYVGMPCLRLRGGFSGKSWGF